MADLGIEVVDKPAEANVLLVTGGSNLKSKRELESTYGALREPRTVVAVGSCAATMGIFKGGYAMTGPIDSIVGAHVRAGPAPDALFLIDVRVASESARRAQESLHPLDPQLQRVRQGAEDDLRPRWAPHDVQIDRNDGIDRPGHRVAALEYAHGGRARSDRHYGFRSLHGTVSPFQFPFGLQIRPTGDDQQIGVVRSVDNLDPQLAQRHQRGSLEDLDVAAVTAAGVESIDSRSLCAHVPHLSP